MLGVVLFATMFPSFVFSFIGGVAADRYDRYKLLLLTQVASMIQALALALMIFFKVYSISGILILSVVLGIINAFDVPARQSLIYKMVDLPEHLPNALALNSSMVNLSRIIGAGIAGLVLHKLGDAVCFGLNALSFVAVIISLLMMKLPEYMPLPRNQNIIGQLKEGFVYIRNTPSIAFILGMLALMCMFVLPFQTLLSAYAKDVFHGDADKFGAIEAAIGFGAFAGAIFLASLRHGRDLKKVIAVSSIIFGLGLVLFSHTTYYPLAIIFSVIAAFGMMAQITISNTLIQTTVAPEMRGRVISFYAMAFFGTQPIGGLLVGYLSQHIGIENTVMAEGVIALLIGVLHLRVIKINKRKAILSLLTLCHSLP